MTAAVLALLALTGVAGLALAAVGERARPGWVGAVPTVLLGTAALLAWPAESTGDLSTQAAAPLAVLAAVAAGGPVATAVLRAADPPRHAGAPPSSGPPVLPVRPSPADPEVLRGGAWIGALERAAVAGALFTGWPQGLAVVLAVKGLGRYAELKAPAAAERFIIGTLASVLWAAACVGVAVLLRS